MVHRPCDPPCHAALRSDPPGEETVALRLRAAGIGVAPGPVSPTGDWTLLLHDDRHGDARLACPNAQVQAGFLPSDALVRWSPDLTQEEADMVSERGRRCR